VQGLDLLHQLAIDMQATGGIDNQHIGKGLASGSHSVGGNIEGLLLGATGEKMGANISGQCLQLLDGGRPVDIRTHHHDLFLVALLQVASQLGNRGGLTGTLQTCHQNDGRRRYGEVELLVAGAHHRFQLLLDDLQELLPGIEAALDLDTHGAVAHMVDKVLDDRQGNVSFQQGHAHFAQGFLDIVFGEMSLAANFSQAEGKSVAEGFKHGHGREFSRISVCQSGRQYTSTPVALPSYISVTNFVLLHSHRAFYQHGYSRVDHRCHRALPQRYPLACSAATENTRSRDSNWAASTGLAM